MGVEGSCGGRFEIDQFLQCSTNASWPIEARGHLSRRAQTPTSLSSTSGLGARSRDESIYVTWSQSSVSRDRVISALHWQERRGGKAPGLNMTCISSHGISRVDYTLSNIILVEKYVLPSISICLQMGTIVFSMLSAIILA